MNRQQKFGSLMCAGVVAAALASGACNRTKDATPAADVQTQMARPANMPLTIAGCLKAGDAADTYVLTTARAEGSGETATYQLVGNQGDTLRDQIGRRVEVSGTLEAQNEIASRTAAQPAKERATGTSGTPTVQTNTELDIKRLTVSTVKPLGDKCDH